MFTRHLMAIPGLLLSTAVTAVPSPDVSSPCSNYSQQSRFAKICDSYSQSKIKPVKELPAPKDIEPGILYIVEDDTLTLTLPYQFPSGTGLLPADPQTPLTLEISDNYEMPIEANLFFLLDMPDNNKVAGIKVDGSNLITNPAFKEAVKENLETYLVMLQNQNTSDSNNYVELSECQFTGNESLSSMVRADISSKLASPDGTSFYNLSLIMNGAHNGLWLANPGKTPASSRGMPQPVWDIVIDGLLVDYRGTPVFKKNLEGLQNAVRLTSVRTMFRNSTITYNEMDFANGPTRNGIYAENVPTLVLTPNNLFDTVQSIANAGDYFLYSLISEKGVTSDVLLDGNRYVNQYPPKHKVADGSTLNYFQGRNPAFPWLEGVQTNLTDLKTVSSTPAGSIATSADIFAAQCQSFSEGHFNETHPYQYLTPVGEVTPQNGTNVNIRTAFEWGITDCKKHHQSVLEQYVIPTVSGAGGLVLGIAATLLYVKLSSTCSSRKSYTTINN